MSEQEEVLAVLRDQEAANGRSDSEAVLRPMAEGVVLFDLPPPLQIKGDAVQGKKELEAWFDTWESGVTVTLDNPTVVVEGDLAVVFGLSRMQGIKKGDGQVDAWNRRTVVLLKLDGEWKIVHEHNSYPMAMDGSGKAMTDLKPR